MILALFALFAWLTVIVFALIPKRLAPAENTILFFGLTIVILNLFSIIDGNLKLIQHSGQPEMFLALCLHRNITLPLGLLVFANCLTPGRPPGGKLAVAAAALAVLSLLEHLTLLTGVNTYTGWNGYLAIGELAGLLAAAAALAAALPRIP